MLSGHFGASCTTLHIIALARLTWQLRVRRDVIFILRYCWIFHANKSVNKLVPAKGILSARDDHVHGNQRGSVTTCFHKIFIRICHRRMVHATGRACSPVMKIQKAKECVTNDAFGIYLLFGYICTNWLL